MPSLCFLLGVLIIFIVHAFLRFHEEDMEYEEFADECRDLTQWMNEVEVTLAQRDPSPADQDGLQHQLEKVKVIDKRSVLRRQSRDTNRNIKRSVYCQYG